VTLRALFGLDDAAHELMPTARELEILQEHIDPGRAVIGRTAKS
jgi:hypothetical protein